ncbi:protein rep [Pseudonocardia nematodicida]|uniref:Protein rep n=1 Tax=Pseudonocardia nematodicida TaxID=1206997 RepID=A0ABV1KAA0_9PSEU
MSALDVGTAPGRRSGARGQAPQAPLGKNVANPSTALTAAERRADRYRLRRVLWEVSGLAGVRKCGRVSRTGEGGPTLRITGPEGSRVAGYAGLVSCGVMSCPCCASKVGARRAAEIETVVERVHAEGGSAALITLTARHHSGLSLVSTVEAVTYAWGRVTSGAAYAAEVARYGITGWVCVLETTHSEAAGFHPHRHALVLFDSPMSQEMVEELAGAWFERWRRGLVRYGCPDAEDNGKTTHRRCSESCRSVYEPIAGKGGLDVRRADGPGVLGSYLSKIQLELSGSAHKRGRGGCTRIGQPGHECDGRCPTASRTPFQILADFAATGNADDWDLFAEYERAMPRRRTMTWSVGTRERYGVEIITDDEIVEDDMGGEDTLVLPRESWREIRNHSEELLTAAERDGASGAIVWLNDRGLSWSWATPFKRLPPPPGPRVAPGSRALLALGMTA